MKCATCGHEMVTEVMAGYVYAESGLPNVTLSGVKVSRCPSCREEDVTIPAIEGLHRAIASVLVRKSAGLTGAEVRFLRKHLGLSGLDFASHMAVTPETVSLTANARTAPTAARKIPTPRPMFTSPL